MTKGFSDLTPEEISTITGIDTLQPGLPKNAFIQNQ
ncbi:hypothetical protein BROSI_A2654 [Candidatus Brocadia sinica JPN1]|uniref:Uncharacterized protein n=1 Tax=Candidatus Brocadia sinica JPN1 TaxID=1197129 RepID=A0ABQ0JZC0_9BACT|nr:hypothetical protein BROSI_A2654 [Candidatus Brocadia sinica JPN1]